MLAGMDALIMAIIHFGLARWQREAEFTITQLKNAALVGLLIMGIGYGGFAIAEQKMLAGLASIMAASEAIWISMLGYFVGRAVSKREWIGLAIGFSGIGILNLYNGLTSDPFSTVVTTIAVIGWSAGSVLATRLDLRDDNTGIVLQVAPAGVLLVLGGLLSGERPPSEISGNGIIALAYLSVIVGVIGYRAYMYLLRHARLAVIGSYAYITPVIGVLLAAAVGEPIDAVAVIAMVFIVFAVVLVVATRE